LQLEANFRKSISAFLTTSSVDRDGIALGYSNVYGHGVTSALRGGTRSRSRVVQIRNLVKQTQALVLAHLNLLPFAKSADDPRNCEKSQAENFLKVRNQLGQSA
jgi:hypothetical protein